MPNDLSSVIHKKSQINGMDVPLQFPEEFSGSADKVLEMKAFKDWCGSVDPEFIIKSILVQSVDMFGPNRVGFLKFKAQVSDKEGTVVPSIVFMRGASVAVLFVLRCDEDGELFTVLTVQARFPTGKYAFHDIPAGMVDDNGDFTGVAAKEMKEETGIEVRYCHISNLHRFVFAEPKSVDMHSHPSYWRRHVKYPSSHSIHATPLSPPNHRTDHQQPKKTNCANVTFNSVFRDPLTIG